MNFALVIPTFNRPDALRCCIQSLLALKSTSWFAVIVNDGSEADYSSIQPLLGDVRIHYITQPKNSGVNAARNVALAFLQSAQASKNIPTIDYLSFIDDDETFEPEALSIAQALLSETPHQWLVLQCFLNNDQKTLMKKTGRMDYIDDYLYGSSLKKDAAHFIKFPLALLARFSTLARNGEEWIYFTAIAKQSLLWAEATPVKHNYHQEGGLFLGVMHQKTAAWIPYAMKIYRPFLAVSLRPHNFRAWYALFIQILKLPLRLIQISLKSLKLLIRSSK